MPGSSITMIRYKTGVGGAAIRPKESYAEYAWIFLSEYDLRLLSSAHRAVQ